MIPATTRIFVCPEPQDMRRSFDGLALAAREHLGEDPQGGALFAFVNKRRNRLKVLWFDRNGYCILYKRLSGARFELPSTRTISASALGEVLRGVEKSRD
ncbi:MAG TPA: IS66 family insertion sequence element accessory protein TnpB [Polyangiaceae bacterium]|nr:IS66 family insertion sequence element accessory protein TnpB [Polyangiaceae bacterium]